MNKNWISPSMLAADMLSFGDEVDAVISAGADSIHLDIMDNHYVPNLTFGHMFCAALRDKGIKIPLDVHLMCSPVDDLIARFADSGAEYITFHPEATLHVDRSIELIKSYGCKAGLVLNPATPISVLDHVLEKLDMVLLMSVNPGFGGQSFIPSVLPKIKSVRERIDAASLSTRLQIDGGVNLENIQSISAAGVDTFVMGSALFSSPSYKETISKAKALIG